MKFFTRLVSLASKLDANQLYSQANVIDQLTIRYSNRTKLIRMFRKAFDEHDQRVVDFINKYGEGEGFDEIIWNALEKGLPRVYQAIDKDIDFDKVWRAIKEMTAPRN